MIKERDGEKALRVCDECGHEQWVNYWNLARKDIHICRYCSCRKTAKNRKNKPWNKGSRSLPKEEGLGYINQNGYKEIWVGRSRTGSSTGYVKEHRLLLEARRGKLLKDSEVVHHVDGDKTNNSTKNLYVCANHREHRQVHSKLERVAMELVRSGAIKFDHTTGLYVLDPNVGNFISKSGELLGNPSKDNQQRSFSEMSEEERSETIQKWSTLKRVEAPDTVGL